MIIVFDCSKNKKLSKGGDTKTVVTPPACCRRICEMQCLFFVENALLFDSHVPKSQHKRLVGFILLKFGCNNSYRLLNPSFLGSIFDSLYWAAILNLHIGMPKLKLAANLCCCSQGWKLHQNSLESIDFRWYRRSSCWEDACKISAQLDIVFPSNWSLEESHAKLSKSEN